MQDGLQVRDAAAPGLRGVARHQLHGDAGA